MLSTRLLHNLGYRSCSTFSSVLTLGKTSQHSGAKSNQTAESDQDANGPPNHDLNKVDGQGQIRQADHARSSYAWDGKLSSSAQYGTHEAADCTKDANSNRKYKRNKMDKWRNGLDWREQGGFDGAGQGAANNQWEQHRPWKHNKGRWDEQDSGKWDSRSTSQSKSDNVWDSDESQLHRLAKHSKKSSGYNHRPSHKAHHPHSHWGQYPSFPQHKRTHSEQTPSSSQSSSDQPRDKPRGKRLRKKEKLGFIESESVPAIPEAEQLLYGLHPVSLALTSGQRQVRRVYHRADARPSDGRLSQVLAECASRGIGTVPLPAAQLDRIAGGTGVHQGVCARVTPLLPRSVDELLVQAGCPPLVGGLPSAAEAEEQKTAASSFWSVEADVMGSEGENGALGVKDADRQLMVSKSETERSSETEPPTRVTSDLEKQTDVSPSEVAAVVERAAHRRRVWLMLDRVHDPMNFGSIIRSSYFLGVDAVIIPDKNSCPLSPTVSKASAGTLEVFPVYSVPADSCRELLQLLASRRWQLLAAGTAADGESRPAGTISADTDTLLVVGNEGRGVDPSLAGLCRPWAVPPQRHLVDGVESLNVGVATGILLSQLIQSR